MIVAVLASESRRLAKRREIRILLAVVVALAALAAALPTSSRSTAYGPRVVVGFVGVAVGLPTLVIAAYLGASLGGEDHELGTGKELHLAGIPRWSIAVTRLAIALAAAVAIPLVALAAATLVAIGETVRRGGFGDDTAALGTGLEQRVVLTVVVGAGFSAIAGLALGAAFRSRLAGFAGWLGMVLGYALVAPFAAKSPFLAAVLRVLPFGAYLHATLGRVDALLAGDTMSPLRTAVALGVWTVLALLAYALCSLRAEP